MQGPTLQIRDADVDDLEALSALCLRSKAHWGYDQDFMQQCREALTLTSESLAANPTRVAWDADGGLLGLAAYQLQGGEACIELLFVEPSAMGRGVGKALLADLLGRLAEKAYAEVWVLSDPGAEAFYLSQGAVRIGLRASDCIPERKLPWLRIGLHSPPTPL